MAGPIGLFSLQKTPAPEDEAPGFAVWVHLILTMRTFPTRRGMEMLTV